MEKVKKSAAFPSSLQTTAGTIQISRGISKRLYIATAAMTGLLSKYSIRDTEDPVTIAKLSFQIADEMLKIEDQ